MPTPACVTPNADIPVAPPPAPGELAYSLTLPAALASPGVARAAARAMLRAHGLDAAADATLQTISELAACACLFAPGEQVYVSLRCRDDTIRVALHDGHPRHASRPLADHCDTRRTASLRLLGCVVRECGGEWGFGEAGDGGAGTRMWAVLPCDGAVRYARCG